MEDSVWPSREEKSVSIVLAAGTANAAEPDGATRLLTRFNLARDKQRSKASPKHTGDW